MGIDILFSPYLKLPWFLPCPGLVVVHDVNILHSPEYDTLKDEPIAAISSSISK